MMKLGRSGRALLPLFILLSVFVGLVDAQPCRDKKSFRYGGEKGQDCTWLKGQRQKKKDRICSNGKYRKKAVNTHWCPKACETCVSKRCSDRKSFKYKGKKGQDCPWLHEQGEGKKNRICRNGTYKDKAVSTYWCPKTCETCEDNAAPPTSLPVALETLVDDFTNLESSIKRLRRYLNNLRKVSRALVENLSLTHPDPRNQIHRDLQNDFLGDIEKWVQSVEKLLNRPDAMKALEDPCRPQELENEFKKLEENLESLLKTLKRLKGIVERLLKRDGDIPKAELERLLKKLKNLQKRMEDLLEKLKSRAPRGLLAQCSESPSAFPTASPSTVLSASPSSAPPSGSPSASPNTSPSAAVSVDVCLFKIWTSYEPVEGATINCYDADDGLIDSGETDSDGCVSFQDILGPPSADLADPMIYCSYNNSESTEAIKWEDIAPEEEYSTEILFFEEPPTPSPSEAPSATPSATPNDSPSSSPSWPPSWSPTSSGYPTSYSEYPSPSTSSSYPISYSDYPSPSTSSDYPSPSTGGPSASPTDCPEGSTSSGGRRLACADKEPKSIKVQFYREKIGEDMERESLEPIKNARVRCEEDGAYVTDDDTDVNGEVVKDDIIKPPEDGSDPQKYKCIIVFAGKRFNTEEVTWDGTEGDTAVLKVIVEAKDLQVQVERVTRFGRRAMRNVEVECYNRRRAFVLKQRTNALGFTDFENILKPPLINGEIDVWDKIECTVDLGGISYSLPGGRQFRDWKNDGPLKFEFKPYDIKVQYYQRDPIRNKNVAMPNFKSRVYEGGWDDDDVVQEESTTDGNMLFSWIVEPPLSNGAQSRYGIEVDAEKGNGDPVKARYAPVDWKSIMRAGKDHFCWRFVVTKGGQVINFNQNAPDPGTGTDGVPKTICGE